MDYLAIYIVLVYSWLTVKGFEISLTPPSGPYCTSQNLTMTCTITNYHGNRTDLASELTFTYNNQPVDPGTVTIVNGTTAQYLITDKIPEKNFFYVDCCLRETCSKSPYPSGQMIHSYVHPVPVQNLTCVVHGIYNGPIRCRWDYGVDYTNSWNSPTIIFIWRISNQTSWNKSTGLNLTTSSFDLDVNVNYLSSWVGVNITSSVCGYKVVEERFYDVKIVQLSPVSDLSGVTLNSSCIHLSWGPPLGSDKAYTIHCVSIWNSPKDVQFTTTNQTTVQLCDLIPATFYNCSVRVKLIPNGWEASIWSQDQSIRVRTMEDVPGASPAVVTGAYMWENNECSDKQRTGPVWIYWKPISPRHYNGNLTGTVLTYNTRGSPVKVIANASTHSARLVLDCQRSHVVTIQAANNRGLSNVKSVLVVSSRQETPELIVEEMGSSTGTRYLEWTHPVGQPVNNYTVFYTTRKPLGSCTPEFLGPIKWEVIQRDENSTSINVTANSLHCFAISVQTDTGSSGLNWTDCIHGTQKVPRPPDDVSVTLGQTDNTLRVSWTRMPCSTDQPFIRSYDVAYCPVNSDKHCKGSLKIVHCTGTSSSLILDHLDADEYKVNVRGVTRFNERGNWSLAVFQQPGVLNVSNRSLTAGQIAGVVVSPIGLGLGVLVAISLIRRYKKHLDELKRVDIVTVHPDNRSGSIGNIQDSTINLRCQSKSETDEDEITTFTCKRDNTGQQTNGVKRDPDTTIQDNTKAKLRLPDGYVEIRMLSHDSKQTSVEDGARETSIDATVNEDIHGDLEETFDTELVITKGSGSKRDIHHANIVASIHDHHEVTDSVIKDVSATTNTLSNAIPNRSHDTSNTAHGHAGNNLKMDRLVYVDNRMSNVAPIQCNTATSAVFHDYNTSNIVSDSEEFNTSTSSDPSENHASLSVQRLVNSAMVSDQGVNTDMASEQSRRMSNHDDSKYDNGDQHSRLAAEPAVFIQTNVHGVSGYTSGYIDSESPILCEHANGMVNIAPGYIASASDALFQHTNSTADIAPGYVDHISGKLFQQANNMAPDMSIQRANSRAIMQPEYIVNTPEIVFQHVNSSTKITAGYIDQTSNLLFQNSNSKGNIPSPGYIDNTSNLLFQHANSKLNVTPPVYIDNTPDMSFQHANSKGHIPPPEYIDTSDIHFQNLRNNSDVLPRYVENDSTSGLDNDSRIPFDYSVVSGIVDESSNMVPTLRGVTF